MESNKLIDILLYFLVVSLSCGCGIYFTYVYFTYKSCNKKKDTTSPRIKPIILGDKKKVLKLSRTILFQDNTEHVAWHTYNNEKDFDELMKVDIGPFCFLNFHKWYFGRPQSKIFQDSGNINPEWKVTRYINRDNIKQVIYEAKVEEE